MILTGSRDLIELGGNGLGVDAAQRLAGAVDIKHPFDPSALGVASALPVRYLATKGFAVGNPSVKTLLIQYPELNLHPIEPTRVLGDEMELQPAQHLSGHRRREDLVECCGVVRREIVEHTTAQRESGTSL